MINSKEETNNTYNKIASKYSKSHFDNFWIKGFNIYQKLINGNKILDIGCGAGRDAATFLKDNYNYTGIDMSKEMLKVALKRVPNGEFKQMDFYNLEFPDNTFDGFWASASFLHAPKKDIDTVLQEAKRVIKPNGVEFISMKEKTEMDEGVIKENMYNGFSRYFAFYTKDEFTSILEKNGFKIVKFTTLMEDDKRKTNWLCFFVQKS